MLLIVVALILVALIFDYINGFHDAANSIATVVSTRVLSPGKAVIWAAFFNFIAAFTFGTAVAKTVGVGDGRHPRRHLRRDLRRALRRDHLGPDHLVLRAADELVARADRRVRRARRWPRPGFARDHPGRLDEDASSSSSCRRSSACCSASRSWSAIFWIFRWMPPSRVDRWFRKLQLVSAACVQPQPRRQRRAEDDGDHRRRAVRRRLHRDLLHPVLGGAGRARRDRPRHAGRRLAHHPHDGVEDHQAAAGRRIRRGNERGASRS